MLNQGPAGIPRLDSTDPALAGEPFPREGGYFLAFSHLKKQGKPVTVEGAVEAYIQWIEAKRYSHWTVRGVKNVFYAFYRKTGLGPAALLSQITAEVAQELSKRFTAEYKPGTAWRYGTLLMQVFRCFASGGLLPTNPFATLARPARAEIVPHPGLNTDEIRRLLEIPNLRYPHGIRTRALLEVLSSTGLRLTECTALKVDDVDFTRGMIRVAGKGAQERLVAVSPETLGWLQRYLKEVRPRYAGPLKDFWVGQTGRPINRLCMQKVIRKLGVRAGIEQSVSANTLRRTSTARELGQGREGIRQASIRR